MFSPMQIVLVHKFFVLIFWSDVECLQVRWTYVLYFEFVDSNVVLESKQSNISF